MKVCYRERRFRKATQATLDQANAILDEYAADGLQLTVRQLHYQFVARGLGENTPEAYNRLGKVVSDGRIAGVVDWERIADRTREVESRAHWDAPADIARAAADAFAVDKWADQPCRVEVWVEKNALVEVVARACNPLDVAYLATVGYASQTVMHDAADRFRGYVESGQPVIVVHLADHDPSGLDMTEDIRRRFELFGVGGSVEVRRLALTIDQVREFNPPPNFAKDTDTRTSGYVERFGGDQCWELDAIEPRALVELIRASVEAERDDDRWSEAVERENRGKAELRELAAGLAGRS